MQLKVTVYLQGWLQLNGYSVSQLHHRYPKPYIKLKLIELGIQIFHYFCKKINSQDFVKSELEGPGHLSRVPTQCDFYILEVCFFSPGQDPKSLKSVLGFSLIRFRSKLTKPFQNCKKTMRSERTEMAFKERIFRIIKFPDTLLLVIYFSSIWPNLTEIGQMVVEL